MKALFKKSSNTVLLLNYIGRLLGALNTFFLLPKLLRLEQVGLYAGVHHMIFLLARLDLGQSVIRYGAQLQHDSKGKEGFLGWIWVTTTLWYGLMAGIVFFFQSQIAHYFAHKAPDVIHYMPFVMVTGYIVLINITLKAWYIALDRVLWPSFFQHVVLNLLIIGLIVAYGYKVLSFEQLLVGTAFPYLINLGLLLTDLWRRGELRIGWDPRFFNKSFMYAFTYYSLFTLLAGSMAMLMIRIDNIMVLSMCGKKPEAIYSTIVFMALLLEIPMKVVKQTNASQIVQLLHQKDHLALSKLYKHVTQWQFFLTSVCFTLLYTYMDYLLYVFPKEVVSMMKPLFLFLGSAKLLDNLFRMGSEILLLSRYFMWSLVGGGLLVVGTLMNYYMIQATGMYGASIATGITLLLGGGISCSVIWYRFHMHPWSWQLLGWIGVTLTGLGGQTFLPALPSSWLDLCVRTGFVAIVYGGAWWWGHRKTKS